jgi:hypothetical protein
MTECVLIVRLPDGTIHGCGRQGPWRAFTVEGATIEWCVAAEYAAASALLGATFPTGTDVTQGPRARHARCARRHVTVGCHRWFADACDREPSRKESTAQPLPERLPDRPGDHEFLLPAVSRADDRPLRYEVPPDIGALVSKALCDEHLVLPVSRAGGSLIVAMVDPTNQAARDAVSKRTGFTIEPVIASESAIRSAVARYYDAASSRRP